jgi:hypothetical protein
MTNSYKIPVENLSRIQEHVAKLNKRAKRLGQEPVVLEISEVFYEVMGRLKIVEGESFEKKAKTPMVNISVAGSPPKINGWSLIASVELLDGINLVRAVPGCEVPRSYFNTDSTCQHCGKKRQRKDVFVLNHEDGRYIQVGRQCIADFLGHISADEMAARCTMLSALNEFLEEHEDFIGGGSWSGYEITEFVSACHAAIQEYGWVSKKNADIDGRMATCYTAVQVLRGVAETKDSTRYYEKFLKITDENRKFAEDAIDWASKIDPNTANDFLMNLLAVTRHGFVNERAYGLVAAIPFAYGRELLKIEERKNAPASDWVGTVGERSEFTLTVKSIIPIESDFGHSSLHMMYDENGNQFKWFSTSKDLEIGSTVKLKATVKKHDEYKGVKATLLSRCKEVK